MASYPLGINPKTEKQYKVMIVDDSSTIRIAEKKIIKRSEHQMFHVEH